MEKGIQKLLKVMERLRGENGCPWDREQTLDSLKSFLIEEAYEVCEAIEEKDFKQLKEELGDLLFQIVFETQITKELGLFDFYDVVDFITQKMIARHPHVFGNEKVKDSAEVLENWEKLKKKEGKGVFSGMPKALPALIKALRVQEKAERFGFDWDNVRDVIAKVKEEISELEEAVQNRKGSDASEKIEEEIGDVLFSIVNLARHLNINPESSLNQTVKKFINRFMFILDEAKRQNKDIYSMSLDEMEELWQMAKKRI